jgi:hypothetical protein
VKTNRLKHLAAALLPFVLFSFWVIAYIPYHNWSVEPRHVDPGLGDAWWVPVSNDYSFYLLAVPFDGFIVKEGYGRERVVAGIYKLVCLIHIIRFRRYAL